MLFVAGGGPFDLKGDHGRRGIPARESVRQVAEVRDWKVPQLHRGTSLSWVHLRGARGQAGGHPEQTIGQDARVEVVELAGEIDLTRLVKPKDVQSKKAESAFGVFA